jgi:hypothetical protein
MVQPIRRTYPSIECRPNSKFRNHYLFNVTKSHPNFDYIIEPRHFDEAAQHPGWATAIHKEIKSVLENNTWQVVDQIPTGKRPINTMWIFKAKSSPIDKIKNSKLVS